MRRAAKITISLPVELLEDITRRQEDRGETRSDVIVRLIETGLRHEREQARVEQYVHGYLEHPETDEELAITDRLAVEAATQDPWP